MKRRTKKILSLVMVLVMAFTSTTITASAAETVLNTDGDLQLFMEFMGYDVDVLSSCSNEESITYTTFEGVDGVASKMVLSNGDKVYDFKEGTVTDTIVLKANGDVYLDGNLIKIVKTSVPTVSNASLTDNMAIMPRAQRLEFVSECPFGSRADYNDLTDNVSDNLMLEQEIRLITEAGFKMIVVAALSFATNPIIGKYLGGVFSRILSSIKKHNPYLRAFSIQYQRYVHGIYGFTVTNSMSVAKYTMVFYYDLDCEDPIYVDGTSIVTAYQVFTY